ncbi:SLOG family protein [Microbispora sp. CA-102843]|uniref:SLOG family protein n=1 Tax=Microbispora sp. CA-102843 TaxID=3239952 RepID=UPI003D929947
MTTARRFRVLITGSRTWTDEQAIRDALAVIAHLSGPENVVIVHGACPTGADALADRIASAWTGMTIERHPAKWKEYGKSAGHRRNAEMVELGADICLAFIMDGSRGASHTAALAEQAGIPTRRFEATS